METILIADDHSIVRSGLRILIENLPRTFCIIEASTCAEVEQIMADQQIDYAILDLSYSDNNLFPTIDHIVKNSHQTGILIYSMNSERIYAKRLMGKGIKGYVSKRAKIEELEVAIQSLINGDIYLSTELKNLLFGAAATSLFTNPIDSLSDRELQVAEYIMMGMGTKEIAGQMNLDLTTISTYRRRAFEKLEVQNMIELKEKISLYKS